MFYTYVLKSFKDGKWYTGATANLRERFKAHNSNLVFSTKRRGPFDLIYYEACKNRLDAFAREKFLKSGLGRRYLKNRLKRSLAPTGFTLVEIIVVMGLVAVMATLSVVMGLDTYRSYGFRTEQATLLGALQKARSQAVNNINQAPHGVHIEQTPRQYVIFQGASYSSSDPLNIVFQGNTVFDIATDPLSTDVVFTQLTGRPTPPSWSISLEDHIHPPAHVCLNSEGQINAKDSCP